MGGISFDQYIFSENELISVTTESRRGQKATFRAAKKTHAKTGQSRWWKTGRNCDHESLPRWSLVWSILPIFSFRLLLSSPETSQNTRHAAMYEMGTFDSCYMFIVSPQWNRVNSKEANLVPLDSNAMVTPSGSSLHQKIFPTCRANRWCGLLCHQVIRISQWFPPCLFRKARRPCCDICTAWPSRRIFKAWNIRRVKT